MAENTSLQKPELAVKLQIDNSIKLDPEHPIPISYGGDSFKTLTGRNYIPFLGNNDNLPSLLLEARLTSSTQNACITSITQCVIGSGLVIKDVEKPEADFVTWLANINNDEESINDVAQNSIDGERSTGNAFIEVVRGEFDTKKYVKIYAHNICNCRLTEPDEITGKPAGVIISRLFSKKKSIKKLDLKKVKVIPLYNANALDEKSVWLKNPDGSESTMLHFKNEVAGIDYYGVPASIAGLRYQVAEGKAIQYNLDNFDNNMILGGMLMFKSGMTREEAQQNAKEILLSHVGEGKTGRIAVLSSESGLQDVQFTPFETQQDGSFKEFDAMVESKIISANGWAKELCITEAGGLGKGGDYLKVLWDLKDAMLLNPIRKKYISKIIKPAVKIWAAWMGKKEVEKYEFDFTATMPLSFMGKIDPATFTKVKEARAMAGMEPDEGNGEKYLSEMRGAGNTNKDDKKVNE